VPVGSFIAAGKSLDRTVQRVKRAEDLGYDSAYVTHIAGRDSLTVLAAYAAGTSNIKLGTGVLPIYARTPVSTAQTAATIDEISHGRMVLGLGVSHRVTVENWYGQTIDKPVREMREYVTKVRAIMRNEDPPSGDDDKWPTNFHFMGYETRDTMPIYIAALSPAMLRLAGEIADGVILWLCNPDYIENTVMPEIRKGLERAGRTTDGFDIVAAVPTAVTDDAEQARARLRADLVPYFSLPFYRAMLERSGFEQDIEGFDAGMKTGDTETALSSISDRFLQTLTAIGSEQEAEQSIKRYQDAGATSPCLGGVPGTDFDTTLEALAPLASSAG
jgi:F420-dependent oxidoreductase-like protein